MPSISRSQTPVQSSKISTPISRTVKSTPTPEIKTIKKAPIKAKTVSASSVLSGKIESAKSSDIHTSSVASGGITKLTKSMSQLQRIKTSISNLKIKFFTLHSTDVSKGMNVGTLMNGFKNPLASPKLQEFSQLFRAHGSLEFGTENIKLYDSLKAVTEAAQSGDSSAIKESLTELRGLIDSGDINLPSSFNKTKVVETFDAYFKANETLKTLETEGASELVIAEAKKQLNKVSLEIFDSKAGMFNKLGQECSALLRDMNSRFKPEELKAKLTEGCKLFESLGGSSSTITDMHSKLRQEISESRDLVKMFDKDGSKLKAFDSEVNFRDMKNSLETFMTIRERADDLGLELDYLQPKSSFLSRAKQLLSSVEMPSLPDAHISMPSLPNLGKYLPSMPNMDGIGDLLDFDF